VKFYGEIFLVNNIDIFQLNVWPFNSVLKNWLKIHSFDFLHFLRNKCISIFSFKEKIIII
jgi:hypothetical protein